MNTIRAFIALSLPDDVKRTVTTVSGQLAGTIPDGSVRWVKPNAMHLTLRFLGNIDARRLPEIGRELDTAIAPRPAFILQLGRLGAFPNQKRPRVLWLDLVPVLPATGETLGSLKAAVDRALEPLGFPADTKPFTPHLTLGRVRDRSDQFGHLPWAMTIPGDSFPVTAVHLIESDLRPDGPRYTTYNTATLAATA
jgi:2'-5' RNA ligase